MHMMNPTRWGGGGVNISKIPYFLKYILPKFMWIHVVRIFIFWHNHLPSFLYFWITTSPHFYITKSLCYQKTVSSKTRTEKNFQLYKLKSVCSFWRRTKRNNSKFSSAIDLSNWLINTIINFLWKSD